MFKGGWPFPLLQLSPHHHLIIDRRTACVTVFYSRYSYGASFPSIYVLDLLRLNESFSSSVQKATFSFPVRA